MRQVPDVVKKALLEQARVVEIRCASRKIGVIRCQISLDREKAAEQLAKAWRRLYGDHRRDGMSDQTYRSHRRQGTCKRGDVLGMLRDGEDIVLSRGCSKAGEINHDQAKTLGERRIEERRKCQAAIRKGVEKEKRLAGGRTGSPDEKSLCRRHVHRCPPLIASNACHGEGPRRKGERAIRPHVRNEPAERVRKLAACLPVHGDGELAG